MPVNYCFLWSRPSDLNRRPFDYESNALPTELGRRDDMAFLMAKIGTKQKNQTRPKLKIYVSGGAGVKESR